MYGSILITNVVNYALHALLNFYYEGVKKYSDWADDWTKLNVHVKTTAAPYCLSLCQQCKPTPI